MVNAPAQLATATALGVSPGVGTGLNANAQLASALGAAGLPATNATSLAFPAKNLQVRVDLLLGGVWTDITKYVYQRNPVHISGVGHTDQFSTLQPTQLTLTLNDRDGRFTPKNTAGAYYPNITRNTQIRVFLTVTSVTNVSYAGFRFYGEISEWPVRWDPAQRDVFVDLVANGIWRRLSQLQTTLGSAYRRFKVNTAGATGLRSYWPVEDGSGSGQIIPYGSVAGTGNATQQFVAGQAGLSFASAGVFRGSDDLATLNGALITATVPSGGTATNNVTRFVVSVPAAGDSAAAGGNWNLAEINSVGTVAKFEVYLTGTTKLLMQLRNSGGALLAQATTTTSVNGNPFLVSCELTPSGGDVSFALRLIGQGATGITESMTGTITGATVGQIRKVVVSRAFTLADTAFGHLSVAYGAPTSLVQEAYALGGYLGEFALDRFKRLCGELGIAASTIGSSSSSAPMGPQLDDTLANVFQTIEDTDCGLLYELRDQLGMGYRTNASMANQVPQFILDYSARTVDADLAPSYDDQLTKNNVTVSNWTGYTQQAILTAGPMSVLNPPSGIGNGYNLSRSVSAANDSQCPGIANFLLNIGAVDEVRFPVVTVKMIRSQLANLYSSIPNADIGDYFQITNMPGFSGGGTTMTAVNGTSQALGHTEPEVRLFAGTYYCYYRDDTTGHGRIHLMTSSDGATWAESGSNPMLDVTAAAWDSSYVISPSVWFDGSTYYMFYEGNNGSFSAIGYATATAPGGPWTKFGSNPILSKQGTGFESVLVGTPAVIVISGTWYLFYHGYNGTNDQVALAWASTPSGTWTRHPSNPVIPVGNWFARKVAPSSVWLGADNVAYITLEGDPGSGKFSIGVAQVPAANLQTAVPTLTGGSQFTPMLSASVAGQDNDYVQLPCLVSSAGGTLWLYYSGHSTGGAFRMFRTDVSLTTAATTTVRQLMWGYSETLNAREWTFSFSTVPESAWETGFSPGTIQTAQVPGGSPVSSQAQGSLGLAGLIANGSISPAMLSNGITVHTLGGNAITISVNAPPNPNVNDIWIASATGLISQWNGSAWVPFKFDASQTIIAGTIVTANIAASAITSSLIAAGTVVAGIVDATQVKASEYDAFSTGGQFYAYDTSTPTTGHLTTSIAGATGTDSASNNFPKGLMSQQLTLVDQSSAPAAFSGASVLYTSSAGRLRYLSSSTVDVPLDRSSLDNTNVTMTTQTTPIIMSRTLSYKANEAIVGSEFEIEIDGRLLSPTNADGINYTFDFYVDGVALGGTTSITLGGVVFPRNIQNDFCLRGMLAVDTTGAGGTCTMCFDGGFSRQSVNLGNTATTSAINRVAANQAFDTTANHSLAIYGAWSATTGSGHSATTYRTKFTRRN